MTSEQQQIALCEWWGTFNADTTSLDVLHEMEKRLNPEQRIAYYHELLNAITGRFTRQSTDFEFLAATASQRREALLRTLNLWKE